MSNTKQYITTTVTLPKKLFYKIKQVLVPKRKPFSTWIAEQIENYIQEELAQ